MNQSTSSKTAMKSKTSMIQQLYMSCCNLLWGDMARLLTLLSNQKVHMSTVSMNRSYKDMANNCLVKPITINGCIYLPVKFNAELALSTLGKTMTMQQERAVITNMTKDNFQGEQRKTLYAVVGEKMIVKKFNIDGKCRKGAERESLVSLVPANDCLVFPYMGQKLHPAYQLITRNGYLVVDSARTAGLVYGAIFQNNAVLFNTWDKTGRDLSVNEAKSGYDLFVVVTKNDYVTIKAREEKENKANGVEKLQQWLLQPADHIYVKVQEPAPKFFVYEIKSTQNFNLSDYMRGGYELQTRSGLPISGLEYTGKGDIIIQGADNMKHLQWDYNGKISGDDFHPLDLMMIKVK